MKVFEVDQELFRTCRSLLRKYQKEFSHIEEEDLYVVKETFSDKSTKYADASLVPSHFWPLTDKRIMIRVYDCLFGTLDIKAQVMVLYHELKHFRPNEALDPAEGESKYKLRRHDVEDHYEMNKILGPAWATRSDLPDILNDTSWNQVL